ncbi:MAG: hypothetical protein A2Z25_10810 [Planctomycetes bacterium RBG_16_55_9]|nr:MAG: hypothetical protein A2Z25_10810 [Planctomycetes bacterium RBG_16_55_9]
MLWTSVPPCLRGHLKKQSQFAALHGRARRRFQRVRFCKSVRFYADVFTSFLHLFARLLKIKHILTKNRTKQTQMPASGWKR